jgi:organic radical activating enzyme
MQEYNTRSLSCGRKGTQKSFFLQQNKISSCCRAVAQPADLALGLQGYLEHWRRESQQLDAGVEISGCEHCWIQERQGKESYRHSGTDENLIELYLSNLCNQMCSYCGPKFSSTWQQNLDEMGMFQNISLTAKTNLQAAIASPDQDLWIDQISEYINTCEDRSVAVKLLGGEPLMQQRNLQRLLSLSSKKIKRLAVHTNLNPPTDKFLKWLLANIDTDILHFVISLDATPQYNNWPRARFDQDQFEKNLALICANQIKPMLTSVVSVLSVFDLPNFLSWTQAKQFDQVFRKLFNPDCLDPTLIPREFRQQIWNKIESTHVPNIIKEILLSDTVKDPLLLYEQYQYLSQYFQRNDLDPDTWDNELFGQYWSWLTQNYKK